MYFSIELIIISMNTDEDKVKYQFHFFKFESWHSLTHAPRYRFNIFKSKEKMGLLNAVRVANLISLRINPRAVVPN